MLKLRNAHAGVPTARRECVFVVDHQQRLDAQFAASSCGGSRGEALDQRVLAPFRRAASAAIAARDSRPSPTHSNGLWSWNSSSASKPAVWPGHREVAAPKMPTRRGLDMNGASARNTKWHLGQTPHQRLAGRSPRMWKLRLQLEKCAS
jgi:hypothetical protein